MKESIKEKTNNMVSGIVSANQISHSVLNQDFYVVLAALTKAFSAVEYGLIITDEIALQLHLITVLLKKFGLTSIDQLILSAINLDSALFSDLSLSCLTPVYGNTVANCLVALEAPEQFKLGNDLYEVRLADLIAHKPRFRLIKNGIEVGQAEAKIDYSRDPKLIELASGLELTRENLIIKCLVAAPEYVVAQALLLDNEGLIKKASPLIDSLDQHNAFKYYRVADLLGQKNREKFVRFLTSRRRVTS